jgi:hypothetical protein
MSNVYFGRSLGSKQKDEQRRESWSATGELQWAPYQRIKLKSNIIDPIFYIIRQVAFEPGIRGHNTDFNQIRLATTTGT